MEKLGKEVQRIGQIELELNKLSDIIDRCASQQQALSTRLEGVMKDPVPPGPPQDAKSEELVPMATRIRSLRYSVDRISKSIVDVMERLEL